MNVEHKRSRIKLAIGTALAGMTLYTGGALIDSVHSIDNPTRPTFEPGMELKATKREDIPERITKELGLQSNVLILTCGDLRYVNSPYNGSGWKSFKKEQVKTEASVDGIVYESRNYPYWRPVKDIRVLVDPGEHQATCTFELHNGKIETITRSIVVEP